MKQQETIWSISTSAHADIRAKLYCRYVYVAKQMEQGANMQADQQKDGQLFSCSALCGICRHTGFLIPLSHPQGFITNSGGFLMTMMVAEDASPPLTHTHTHTPSLLPPSTGSLPTVPAFLSSQPIKLTFSCHLSLGPGSPTSHAGICMAAPQETRARGLGQGTRGTG